MGSVEDFRGSAPGTSAAVLNGVPMCFAPLGICQPPTIQSKALASLLPLTQAARLLGGVPSQEDPLCKPFGDRVAVSFTSVDRSSLPLRVLLTAWPDGTWGWSTPKRGNGAEGFTSAQQAVDHFLAMVKDHPHLHEED